MNLIPDNVAATHNGMNMFKDVHEPLASYKPEMNMIPDNIDGYHNSMNLVPDQ